MQSQPRYWTPQGPVTFQMAQCNMTKQMLLDQCVKMVILQYNGQQHQNQQQGQQQDQHQQYNTADRRTKQSSVDAGPAVFKWRQEDEEEERNDRKIDRVARESDANQHINSIEGAELTVSFHGATRGA